MTEQEKQTMDRLGITHETKMVFHFRGYKYDRLDDAIKYAEQAPDESGSSGSKSNA